MSAEGTLMEPTVEPTDAAAAPVGRLISVIVPVVERVGRPRGAVSRLRRPSWTAAARSTSSSSSSTGGSPRHRSWSP